ncbi:dihydrodipicolinate synthase family protein [Paenibacillus lemnae]|uniref:Dihydrodipicolinate synthase family protein n=2 Tax=Paenibacillus lemnae TaxID=1330551 RepID=A0A848M8L4_PAELE|nr:dihydrodipicolinate synthase family protein [Paenibacillus lemnae]
MIPSGVWPTMLTPFTEENRVDWVSLERLIEWYIDQGVHGLFAVCQSSEMFHLSLEERAGIAAFVAQISDGRVPVVASGHTGESFDEQTKELQTMADTGIDALVLISNRLVSEQEGDDLFQQRLEMLLAELPSDLPLGFYECPFPYKRLLNPKLLEYISGTGRFQFLKDTCCDAEEIKRRLEVIQGSGMKLFNANTATLWESIGCGASGYSGIMANFHPSLYVRLWEQRDQEPELCEELAAFLTVTSWIEKQGYPVNAKYHLMLEGIVNHTNSRVNPAARLSGTARREVEQFRIVNDILLKRYVSGAR